MTSDDTKKYKTKNPAGKNQRGFLSVEKTLKLHRVTNETNHFNLFP